MDFEQEYQKLLNNPQALEEYCQDLDSSSFESFVHKRNISGKSVLIIGAGLSSFPKFLKDFFENVTVWEISQTAVLLAQKRFPGIDYVWGDFEQFNQKTFDSVIDFRCLHCLPLAQRESFLTSVISLLQECGVFYSEHLVRGNHKDLGFPYKIYGNEITKNGRFYRAHLGAYDLEQDYLKLFKIRLYLDSGFRQYISKRPFPVMQAELIKR